MQLKNAQAINSQSKLIDNVKGSLQQKFYEIPAFSNELQDSVKEWFYDFRNIYTTMNIADIANMYNMFQIVKVYVDEIDKVSLHDEIKPQNVIQMFKLLKSNQARILKHDHKE